MLHTVLSADAIRTALAPTGHPHPLLTGEARQHPAPAAVDEQMLVTHTVTALPEFELDTPELLHAEVPDDPDCAGLISLNSQGNGQLFTPDEADAFADRVIGWGRQVKTMAGRVRRDAGALTEQQTTLAYDPECGWFSTAPVETRMRDIDADATVAENSQLPFLAAQVVVTDWDRGTGGRTVDGRFTTVWVHYGTSTGELSPSGARQVAAEMRAFADRLDALCDRAEEIAADDVVTGAAGVVR